MDSFGSNCCCIWRCLQIDVTAPITRVFLTLKVENAGTSEVSEVLLAFPPTEAEHLAILKASVAEGKRKKKTYVPLSVNPSESPDAPNGARLYSVSLRSPLKSGEATTVEAFYVLTHLLEPFPAEISQSEAQLVYYRDSATLLSPYHIVEQITSIKTPSNKVESFTSVDPTSRVGSELRYGPYHDHGPYSYSPVIVHFENNNPFAVVEELVREIEISHWGSLQIRDHYKLKHAGARHKGVFSRLVHEILRIILTYLFHVHFQSELEIEPRYPLFGGWKATFTIGYGLPLQDFLFESHDGRRYLNFSFGCPLIETMVDDLTVKVSLIDQWFIILSKNYFALLLQVILPEGSRNPTAAVPFPVDQHLEVVISTLKHSK
ncbi:hypothetical protein BHM03_00001213 [Ensete ventricosum]|uniref:Dolichyl-diphosphooligosaccharide--protein glycosyltransferase subunit 1 n=1 Tax=Ensete ventricosum TaxID=4639 RepID=A0A426ZYP1_ENSVE|nr:hypothetical protein B296_00009207 [Ensete ventricosum]RZR70736.1 hypothetical protein BHM03_00001213 [Ensete ventricosum]